MLPHRLRSALQRPAPGRGGCSGSGTEAVGSRGEVGTHRGPTRALGPARPCDCCWPGDSAVSAPRSYCTGEGEARATASPTDIQWDDEGAQDARKSCGDPGIGGQWGSQEGAPGESFKQPLAALELRSCTPSCAVPPQSSSQPALRSSKLQRPITSFNCLQGFSTKTLANSSKLLKTLQAHHKPTLASLKPPLKGGQQAQAVLTGSVATFL